jgi:transcriptional regulator with XRE-family HTH domain
MPTRPTTLEQKADAARLKALYDAWTANQTASTGNKPPQEEIAHRLGFTQSTISQRLAGTMAMNESFAAKIALLIGCSVDAFSPDLAASIKRLCAAVTPPHARDTEPSVPNLDTALEVLGIKLAAAPFDKREAIATNLAGWAREGGADHWRQTVFSLLSTPTAAGKRHRA